MTRARVPLEVRQMRFEVAVRTATTADTTMAEAAEM